MENTQNTTYTAIRMANGSKTHLASVSSSTTSCGKWMGNTRQYPTDEKEITCSACAKRLAEYAYYAEAVAQGFTAKEVK